MYGTHMVRTSMSPSSSSSSSNLPSASGLNNDFYFLKLPSPLTPDGSLRRIPTPR
jgi:hypothetical protein